MDQPTDSDALADAFRVSRRGYDRQQVDAHISAAAERIETLEHRIRELESGMSELGLNRPTDLATELDLVGEEVKRVLAEARVAAEQMRSRAADDAARWRTEADEESRAVRESARSTAYAARRSVWENGTAMLAAAVSEGEALVVASTERALFAQAEAEREASRLTGDAKREREESLRAAREEAERLVSSGRQEAESMVAAARHQADAAQERARALEVRRTELMAELEAARATIAGVEPEPPPAPDPVVDEALPLPEDAIAIELDEKAGSHWPDDEGSVKIVAANRVLASEPVDADEMVAEVEALRKGPIESLQPEPELLVVPPAEGQGDAEDRSDDAEGLPEPAPESELLVAPPAEGRGDAEDRSDDAEGLPESEPEPAPDPLVGLFAQLREPGPTPEPEPPVESSPTWDSSSSGGDSAEGDGGGQTPDVEEDLDSSPLHPITVATPDDEESPLAGLTIDPFDLRERLLLPAQNRALRIIKRNLVETQNRALENLRLTEGWEPDASIVSEEVTDALVVLARESMVAGFAAAAEMRGSDQTPQPDAVEPGDPSVEFGAALIEATQGSVARSRDSGAGHRETGSSLSRVFRSWRTDDAERRVQFASRAAYHKGLTAALAELGSKDVTVVVSGRPCPECPENKGPWTISEGVPRGTTMPPARLECACTIVPSP
jgi:cell division septum initiation protein DivIVA